MKGLGMCIQRRDSKVGMETSYEMDDRGIGVRVPVVSRIFSPRRPYLLLAPPPPVSYPMGTGGSFPEYKAAVA
jgi:hypothetical protein